MSIDAEDDDYAEVLAEHIIAYLINQQAAGREIVYESEIWKVLGNEFPEGRYDQPFLLKDYTKVKLSNNIISIADYKNRKIN